MQEDRQNTRKLVAQSEGSVVGSGERLFDLGIGYAGLDSRTVPQVWFTLTAPALSAAE